MTPVESIARAEDLLNLLDHIAWKETIAPELDRTREHLVDLLIAASLGRKVRDASGSIISIEQLAGRIAGLDWIRDLLESILVKGDRAIKTLRERDLEITLE